MHTIKQHTEQINFHQRLISSKIFWNKIQIQVTSEKQNHEVWISVYFWSLLGFHIYIWIDVFSLCFKCYLWFNSLTLFLYVQKSLRYVQIPIYWVIYKVFYFTLISFCYIDGSIFTSFQITYCMFMSMHTKTYLLFLEHFNNCSYYTSNTGISSGHFSLNSFVRS